MSQARGYVEEWKLLPMGERASFVAALRSTWKLLRRESDAWDRRDAVECYRALEMIAELRGIPSLERW